MNTKYRLLQLLLFLCIATAFLGAQTPTTLVGAIPGQFAVSPSGGATYTIPIECPSGINGTQPGLSLVYNSQAGNGIAGWGWNLNGMSAISRAPKTEYFDGVNAPVVWDNTDALTLDGQRLIKVQSWPATTGLDSVEYRTENESYNRIVGINVQSWGPTFFRVYTKAGTTMIYGNSLSLGSYSPFYRWAGLDGLVGNFYFRSSWNLVEMIDNNGNYIQFEYVTKLNSKVGNVIRYITYGSNKGQAGTALKVTFDYESRTDNIQGWMSGKESLQQLRLKTIQTTVDNVEQRLYTLTYGTDNISRPTSIELKHNGTAVLSPLTFVYGNTKVAETNTDISFITKDANNADKKPKLGLTAIDLDGDGILEIGDIYSSAASNIPGYVSCNFGIHYKKNGWINSTYFPMSASYLNLQKGLAPNFGDFNANGTAESVFAYREGDNLRISITDRGNNDASLYDNWVGVTTKAPFILVGNFYGDPCSSAIIIYNDPVTLSDGTFRYRYNILAGNLNGTVTLKSEAYLIVTSKIKSLDITNISAQNLHDDLWLNLENGTNLLVKNNYTTAAFSGGTSYQMTLPFNIIDKDIYRIIDFNRDGLTDVVYRQNNTEWKIAYNKGGGSFGIETLSISCDKLDVLLEYNKLEVADINNDGLLDIIVGDEILENNVINTTWRFFLNTGSGFTLERTVTSPERAVYSCFADVKGDGKIYWVHSPSSGQVVITDFGYGINKNQLTKVTDPLQGDQVIEYKTLADCTEYNSKTDWKDGINTNAQYLSLGFQPFKTSAFSLVSKYTSGLNKQTYHYGTALMNWKVRGFVGFRFTGVDDETAKVSSFSMSKPMTTASTYTGPYLLLPRATKISSLTSGTLTSEVSYDYSITKNTSNKMIVTTLDAQTETNALKNASISSSFEYDSYGNMTDMTKIFDKTGLSETHAYIYDQFGAWCPNKVTDATVTRAANVETFVDGSILSEITRTTSYGYDGRGNLTSETTDPNTTNSLTTTYGGIDKLGHAATVTVTANSKSRTSSVTYKTSGRFIDTKTNVLGEVTTYTWNEQKGILDSELNPIGTKSYTYNAINQLIGTINEDGTTAGSVMQWATVGNAMGAKYKKYSTASGSAPVTIWYNAYGQEIRKETYGLSNKKISVSTEYNDRGLVYRVSDPYFDADESTKKWATTNLYDEFGRPTTITNSDNKTTTYTYNNRQNPNNTRVVSPESTTETLDDGYGNTLLNVVNGKLVYLVNNAAGQPWYSVPEYGGVLGAPIIMEYDLQGNRTKITDPDAGVVESQYNGFGELIEEKQKIHNAVNYVTTTNTYDATTGRLLNINRAGEVTTYTYDADPTKKRRVSSIEIVGKNKQTFTYDNYDRVTNVTEVIGAKTFSTSKTYDTNGKVLRETFPSGYYTQNNYDANGYLTEITDVSSRSIWKAVTENAKGQLLQVLKGNNTVNYQYYDNGLPYTMSATGVVNMEYVFDTKYNLYSREDKITTQKEVMGYDTQNRLTSWTVTRNGVTAPSNTLTFDDATTDRGNIAQRSELGNYVMNYGEGNNKPHALTSIAGAPASVNPYPLSITYTNFKKVASISQGDGQNYGSAYYELSYGVDDQRRKSLYYATGYMNPLTSTRYYVGNYEEEITAATGKTKKIHYLSGAVLIKETGLADKFYYSYADYQGSLIALQNTTTGVIEKYAYDPWGARRNPTNWTLKDTRTTFIVNRGYTGHEHIDAFGIINMNGRVYDPLTAQFYSPDPQLQSPGNWLNYNRYGYCYGNPFKYTDPSGEIFWLAIVGAFVMNATIQGGTAMYNGGSFWSGAIKGTLTSAFSVGVGASFGMLGQTVSTALGIHGTLGAAAVSGTFGFAGAGLTSLATTGKWDWSAAISAGATAALFGGINGYNAAKVSGRNVWWGGKDIKNGRTQYSFFTSEKPKVYDSPVDNAEAMIENGCGPIGMQITSNSYGNSSEDQFYWRDEYCKYKGIDIKDFNGYDYLEFEKFVESRGYSVESIQKDELINSVQSGKRVGVAINQGHENKNPDHFLNLKRVEVWSTGKMRITFIDGMDTWSMTVGRLSYRYYNPQFWSIFK